MLFLSQRQYIAIILARAIMTNCKPCSTHVDTSSKLPSSDALVENPTHYRSIAGDLQYLTSLALTLPMLCNKLAFICMIHASWASIWLNASFAT